VRLSALVKRVRTHVELRHPPKCPEGSHTAPPDFIGLGAQRCGTTWLYSLIAAHPGVHGEAVKELHYFHRYWNRPFDATDATTYAQYFPRADGLLAGEWSPGYLSHFWVPPLLDAAAPDAKLLVSLRDPVERYRSGLALQSETRRPNAASASTAFRLGCYGMQLEHLFSSVDRARVLVVQFEACTRDPVGAIARIYEFLGLDATFRPPSIERRVNEARTKKLDLDPDRRTALVDAYTPDVERLLALDVAVDVRAWPNFDHLD
jgi:sulfotransferase family protein